MKPGMKSLRTNPELIYSLGPASKLFKREIISDLQMPDHIEIGEDQPFVLECLLRSKSIYTVDEIVYYYRSREAEVASLSQVVKENPMRTLRNLILSLELGLELCQKYLNNQYEQDLILTNYFNRVIKADIWPAVIQILKLRDGQAQKEMFEKLDELQNFMPRYLFKENVFFFQMVLLEFIERYSFIQKEAKNSYVRLMAHTFDRIDSNVKTYLVENETLKDSSKKMRKVMKSIHYKTSVPIFNYLLFRKIGKISSIVLNKIQVMFRKAKTLLKSTVLRRILFPIYKVNQSKNKIVFLTNKDKYLTESFNPIYSEMVSRKLEKNTYFHFKMNRPRTFKEMSHLLKDVAGAKIIFLDDYYRQLYGLKTSPKTDVVQLWHAAGAFKKFGYSAIGSLDSNTQEFEKRAHQNYSHVICSSEEIRPFYAEAFNVKEENVLALGTPRTDCFFDETYKQIKREEFIGKYPMINGRKIVTYAPTFRGGPGVRQKFDNHFDVRRFIERFSDEYVLVVKMHPSVKSGIRIYDDMKDDVLNMSNMNMNDLLLCTDVLVTDYSSVIFDYSLLNKPIIFYAYDLEEYMEERAFYYDYKSFVPGPIVTTNDELYDAISKVDTIDLTKISDFSDRFFDNNKGNSAKKIVDQLIDK